MALKQVIDVGGQGEAPRSRDIAGSGSAYAKNTNFDPTGTDFESTNLQALGEEIDGSLNTKASKTNLSNYILTGTKPSTALSSGTFFVDKDGALRVATANIATTDDVGSGNSAVKSVGEVLSELNSNLGSWVDVSSEYTLSQIENANINYVFLLNRQLNIIKFTIRFHRVPNQSRIITIPEKYEPSNISLMNNTSFVDSIMSYSVDEAASTTLDFQTRDLGYDPTTRQINIALSVSIICYRGIAIGSYLINQ